MFSELTHRIFIQIEILEEAVGPLEPLAELHRQQSINRLYKASLALLGHYEKPKEDK